MDKLTELVNQGIERCIQSGMTKEEVVAYRERYLEEKEKEEKEGTYKISPEDLKALLPSFSLSAYSREYAYSDIIKLGVMSVKKLTKIFKALANERRLRILKYLMRGEEASVGEISKEISLSFKSTSRHLLILENADLVGHKQEALYIFYFINSEAPKKFLNLLK